MNNIIPLLNVQEVERSLGFWRDILGFEVLASADDDGRPWWARIRKGQVDLMLNGKGDDPAPRLSRPRFRDVVLYIALDDVHAFVRGMREKGISIEDPETQEYGVDETYLVDPDGYELAFTSPTDLSARR